ncbi:hypothetical protein AB0873_09475 [Micromonospora sp. NPDC047707]|uniref:hypothetical protein n=1 Tax=Micromonospora sp. NPDC047707 TaxID=3154498 RepID=UPI00345699F2
MLPPTMLAYLATWPWQLGDVATWLSAFANVATVILALAAAVVGYRVYKVESGRDARAELDRRERAADERRSQAALVSVWYGRSDTPMRDVGPWPIYVWGGWIANASYSPIYDVRVVFHRPAVENVTPGGSWTGDVIKVVPPHRGELFVRIGDEAPEDLTDSEVQNDLDVSLEFRDAGGRYWLRDRHGYLHELPGPGTQDGRAGPRR